MKVGGTRRLLIPAAEAYGANPPSGSGIPANADLVFDVTLQSIGQ
jgi:FKBP-type peptidyl-prolyl cis-trans isomerase